ncbi:hypothetical protein TNCV_1235131 [Trichonephila clavipes]|nr:hypothetical protein TNCV_1235131 [Trichonephila clavipes]
MVTASRSMTFLSAGNPNDTPRYFMGTMLLSRRGNVSPFARVRPQRWAGQRYQANGLNCDATAVLSCPKAITNARELDEQILEVKINPQEKNTVLDTSTNKDTLYKEKESENENEETKWVRNDFAHYVGTPIDADLREQILILGPYQPKGNFQKDAKGRSFSSSYNSFISKEGQKIERKWLYYSTRLYVANCQTLPVTSAMAERLFSKLKLVKKYPRCTMSEERLSYLSLISIEQEARTIQLDELITDFAKKNARRQSLFL